MSQWLIVGERTGKTEQVFSKIRNYFQNQTEQTIARGMVLIEPVLIALVGLFLILLIMTVIVPVFSLYGTVL
jgi:type II secretory pathway component PulF